MERAKRMAISIPAPHEGVRRKRKALSCWKCYFNPRTPRGGATLLAHGIDGNDIISIHAPHEGVRPIGISSGVISLYFNPRTPRGGATFLCLLQ